MHKLAHKSSLPLRAHQNKSPAWWLSYLQTHPLQSTFALTGTLGGLLLLSFFIQLQAMPELDLAGAGSILQAVALVGLGLSFFLTACAFGGGLILRSHSFESVALREGCGAALLHIPVIVGSIETSLTAGEFDYSHKYMPTLISWVLCTIIYALWLPGSPKRDLKAKMTYATTYAWLSMLWIFIGGLAVMSFLAMSAQNDENNYQGVRLSIWVTWCVTCNFVIATVKRVKLTDIVVASFLSTVVLLTLSYNGMALPKAVVRSLGLGELPVALLVTEAGCQHLNQATGQKVCIVKANEKSALVCPALLRSRIGSPYFIGFSPLSPLGAWPANDLPARTATVALPKAEVLGWSRIEFKYADASNSERRAASQASQQKIMSPVVTRWDSTVQNDWIFQQCGMGV